MKQGYGQKGLQSRAFVTTVVNFHNKKELPEQVPNVAVLWLVFGRNQVRICAWSLAILTFFSVFFSLSTEALAQHLSSIYSFTVILNIRCYNQLKEHR